MVSIDLGASLWDRALFAPLRVAHRAAYVVSAHSGDDPSRGLRCAANMEGVFVYHARPRAFGPPKGAPLRAPSALLTQAKRLQWLSARRYEALGGAASVAAEGEGEETWARRTSKTCIGRSRWRATAIKQRPRLLKWLGHAVRILAFVARSGRFTRLIVRGAGRSRHRSAPLKSQPKSWISW